MNVSNFFGSYMGMYIAQAFSHSLIAALVVDRAIHAWKITDPLVRQRFSLIVMVFPILSFPLYQIINPQRGSISFRLEALFDINRWLNIELWGTIPLSILFIVMLSGTALIFLLQEMIPIARHMLESRASASDEETQDSPPGNPAVDKVLSDFPGEKPDISVIDDDDFVIFSTTGKNPRVFLSTGAMGTLNTQEMQAAVAHELAHIARSRRPLLVIIYIIRVLMFFNPVVLVEFRRIVQEEEKICDDMAVSLTGKRSALAETLKKFGRQGEQVRLDAAKNLSTLGTTLEDYSHSVHMESRIKRLEGEQVQDRGGGWLRFLITLSSIGAINYFVV